MIHTLFENKEMETALNVSSKNNITTIAIKNYLHNKGLEINLQQKELSDFIGILLHVQAKIKRDRNG